MIFDRLRLTEASDLAKGSTLSRKKLAETFSIKQNAFPCWIENISSVAETQQSLLSVRRAILWLPFFGEESNDEVYEALHSLFIGVIIYDPDNDDTQTLNMFQNNTDVLSLYTQQWIGAILLNLARDPRSYLNITLKSTDNGSDGPNGDGSWYGSRSATIFIVVSIAVLVSLCIMWFVFYYCQRYRSRTAKDRMQTRLASAAKKALNKITLITVDSNSTSDEPCVVCLDAIKTGDTVRKLGKTKQISFAPLILLLSSLWSYIPSDMCRSMAAESSSLSPM